MKKLALVFLILIIAKIFLSIMIPSPSAFSDEYTYSKLARSFFYEQGFTIHGIQDKHRYPPLYPMIISPAYIAENMNFVYIIIKIINVILSTLIIIPLYLLAKEFVSKDKALLISTIISLIPAIFSFSPYILSENLFYTLVAFTVYFTYKLFTKNKIKYALATGLFIGLSYLTKNIGLILILLPITGLIINQKDKKLIRNILISYIPIILLISMWIVRNYLLFGPTLAGIFGNVGNDDITSIVRDRNYFLVLINWLILYSGYIIIGSGILPSIGIFNALKSENKNLKKLTIIGIVTIILFILVSANHATGARGQDNPVYDSPFSNIFTERPIGRYVDAALPVLMIIGLIGLVYPEKMKIQKYIITFIALISTQLIIAPLFPVNNLSLAHIGIIKYIIDFITKTSGFSWFVFILMAILILFITIGMQLLYKKYKLKVFYILAIIFLLTSLLNYGITYYNAKSGWYDKPQMQIGLWFNEYDKETSNTLIDKKYEGKITKDDQNALHDKEFFTPLGFWLNDNIKIGDINNTKDIDYIITKDKLKLELIKNIGDIYIYKNG